MKVHESASGINIVVLVFACLIVSIIATTYAPNQLTRDVFATNGPINTTTTTTSSFSLKGGNTSLGSPQFSYTEYDKTTSFKPTIVNGTHGIQISFIGQGILNGINVTDYGKAFVTNISGTLHTVAHGELVSGLDGNAGTVDHTDQAIGHYGADGKLRDTGIILNTRATGNLAFLGNLVGIYKDESYKDGIITKTWFWK
jgi:hypothetical protein